jgi:hypothetical protein
VILYVLKYGSDILVGLRDVLHTLKRDRTACTSKTVAGKRQQSLISEMYLNGQSIDGLIKQLLNFSLFNTMYVT